MKTVSPLIAGLLNHQQELQRELAERSHAEFTRLLWPYVDPADYVHNWHIDAISEHLQGVLDGYIRNLLITVPPRHMKSISVSVSLPPFAWLDDQGLQFLYSSYAQNLATRDNVKSRRLIESPVYQSFWGDRFRLTTDQNTKQKFENDKGGYRMATSVDGSLTGEGGDILIIDDAHNVRQAESETTMKATIDWYREAMSTRLNNPKTGRKIVIGQRVHHNDLPGYILESDEEFTHLNLPAEYEADHKCQVYINEELFFEDPRQVEGELLFPERFGRKEIEQLKTTLGPYGAASQLQQRPTPREGGMFHPDKITIIDGMPRDVVIEIVRYWDKAGTEGGGAYTAGGKLARMRSGNFLIMDMVRGQWRSDLREQKIKETAVSDGVETQIWIEQEPGSGGKESAENTIRNLAGFIIQAERPTGAKELRADPFSVQVNGGNVYMLKGEWNRDVLEELRHFPMGKYKDQVDALAGAFNKVVSIPTAGTW